jgi:hypothetical protein
MEVGLTQYEETFLANFTHGGQYLSRHRLQRLRMQDLSKMNITNFADQKILFKHITLVLEHEFKNPNRMVMSSGLSPKKSPADPSNALNLPLVPNSAKQLAGEFKTENTENLDSRLAILRKASSESPRTGISPRYTIAVPKKKTVR